MLRKRLIRELAANRAKMSYDLQRSANASLEIRMAARFGSM